jgi:hypothetical protein
MLNRDNQWVPATEPMHFDTPAVVGGSAIDTWQPGGYYEQTKNYHYQEAIKRVQLAQQAGTLPGILWHQGESDSNPEQAAVYEQKLTQLIGRFRFFWHRSSCPRTFRRRLPPA